MEMFLTSNHTLVQKVEIVPGIADHDIMIADVNVKPQIAQQSLDQYLCIEKLIGIVLENIFQNLPLISC